MTFEPYKEWKPGDDDLPDVREILRQQQAQIEALRDNVKSLASVILMLNEQNAMLNKWLVLHSQNFESLQSVIKAQLDWTENLHKWVHLLHETQKESNED